MAVFTKRTLALILVTISAASGFQFLHPKSMKDRIIDAKGFQGQNRAAVKAKLGAPNQIRSGTLPKERFWGPQTSLTRHLVAGQPYEEWIFKDSKFNNYLWFAGSMGGSEPPAEWNVIATASVEAGAIF